MTVPEGHLAAAVSLPKAVPAVTIIAATAATSRARAAAASAPATVVMHDADPHAAVPQAQAFLNHGLAGQPQVSGQHSSHAGRPAANTDTHAAVAAVAAVPLAANIGAGAAAAIRPAAAAFSTDSTSAELAAHAIVALLHTVPMPVAAGTASITTTAESHAACAGIALARCTVAASQSRRRSAAGTVAATSVASVPVAIAMAVPFAVSRCCPVAISAGDGAPSPTNAASVRAIPIRMMRMLHCLAQVATHANTAAAAADAALKPGCICLIVSVLRVLPLLSGINATD